MTKYFKPQKWFYLQLAKNNILHNQQVYFPFFVSSIGAIVMFFLMQALYHSIIHFGGVPAQEISFILNISTNLVGVFCVLFLFYTHGVLVKQRQQELGLLVVSGMSKHYILRMMFYELALLAAFSLLIGIMLGALFHHLLVLVLLNLLKVTISAGFELLPEPILVTLIFFSGLFLSLLARGCILIHAIKPIELLKGSQAGEREPRVRRPMLPLSILIILAGYAIALLLPDPIQSLPRFLLSLTLIIGGTYLLFVCGSQVVLSHLQHRPSYYYQTQNFIYLSHMIYRMKQNALGLASICILSTLSLVMVVSSLSLYLSIPAMLPTQHTRDVMMSFPDLSDQQIAQNSQLVEQLLQEHHLTRNNLLEGKSLLPSATLSPAGDLSFSDVDPDRLYEYGAGTDTFYVITRQQYERYHGEELSLKPAELLLYPNHPVSASTLKVWGRSFSLTTLTSKQDPFPFLLYAESSLLVVADESVRQSLATKLAQQGIRYLQEYFCFFNLSDPSQSDQMVALLKKQADGPKWVVGSRSLQGELLARYGTLCLVGIFCGVLFTLATGFIVYYKQLSEGYQDQARFQLLTKVGMRPEQTKQIIRKQILTLFFLPLTLTLVHLLVASPVLLRILSGLNMHRVSLFLVCMAASFVGYSLLYYLIYRISSKTYYAIVSFPA